MHVTVDFSKCYLNKITDTQIVINGTKPRAGLRNFGTDIVYLPLKEIDIVSHKTNEIDYTTELHIKMPEWLFRNRFDRNKRPDIVKRIKFINLDE